MNEFEKDLKECGYVELYAKTGVVSRNRIEGTVLFTFGISFIWSNVIDLTIEETEKQFYSEVRAKYDSSHNECLPENYNFIEDPLELVDWLEKDRALDCCDVHNYLINFIPDPDHPGEYIEDPEAEYSAYIGETDGFVTMSKYVCRAAPGSPCIPNQACLDDEYSSKTEWAFTLPPDIWGECLPEGMEIIKVDKKIYNLSGILNKLGRI